MDIAKLPLNQKSSKEELILFIKEDILKTLNEKEEIKDSYKYAIEKNYNLQEFDGALKSLNVDEIIFLDNKLRSIISFTPKGKSTLKEGSPEFNLITSLELGKETSKDEMITKFGSIEAFQIAFNAAMKNKWIKPTDKTITRIVEKPEDLIKPILENMNLNNNPDLYEKKKIEELKKAKYILVDKLIYYDIKKGKNFTPVLQKFESELSAELLAIISRGERKIEEINFKPYNIKARGKIQEFGNLHPLMKVKDQIKSVLLEMGFEEMPTNMYVESSFWNFDSLFQPQQHPARDLHDTFFMKSPETTLKLPEEYVQNVKAMHEKGGFGSLGYKYDWKLEESKKNILRTHTTACSSRMLYKLIKDGFKPTKYFSIDRVFRNESTDSKHLAEFHQIEGLVAGTDVNIRHLMGTISHFFKRMGISPVKFKPTYNPYTEPSMEIFGYHSLLKQWVEIGNSGIFRPEMLRPMGFPENVKIIAWGLSLERPTMIHYGITNIRDLFGSKVPLKSTKKNPIYLLIN